LCVDELYSCGDVYRSSNGKGGKYLSLRGLEKKKKKKNEISGKIYKKVSGNSGKLLLLKSMKMNNQHIKGHQKLLIITF
jgi:hypothetical protein